MRLQVVIGILLAVLALVAVAYFGFNKSQSLRPGELTGIPKEFLAILPKDVTPAQRTEIEGLLERFQAKAEADEIRPEDVREVMTLITQYLDRGSVTHRELNLLMAKVGYYSYRGLSPDSTGIHPLLEQTLLPPDTVSPGR